MLGEVFPLGGVGGGPGCRGIPPRRLCDVPGAFVPVCRDGTVPRQTLSTSARARRPASGPSTSPTATARLSVTTGLSDRRDSSSYHSRIWGQSFSEKKETLASATAVRQSCTTGFLRPVRCSFAQEQVRAAGCRPLPRVRSRTVMPTVPNG